MYKQIWFRSSLDFYEFLSCLFVCHQRHYLSNIIDFSVYRWHDDTPGVEWREREWEIVQAKTEAMVARNKKKQIRYKMCTTSHIDAALRTILSFLLSRLFVWKKKQLNLLHLLGSTPDRLCDIYWFERVRSAHSCVSRERFLIFRPSSISFCVWLSIEAAIVL